MPRFPSLYRPRRSLGTFYGAKDPALTLFGCHPARAHPKRGIPNISSPNGRPRARFPARRINGIREALNDSFYLQFLMGTVAEDSLAQAQALMAAKPEMLAYRMTVLMGLLQQNRTGEGLGLLLEMPVNWFEARSRWRLLVAVVLHREGYREEARRLVEATERNSLLAKKNGSTTE